MMQLIWQLKRVKAAYNECMSLTPGSGLDISTHSQYLFLSLEHLQGMSCCFQVSGRVLLIYNLPVLSQPTFGQGFCAFIRPLI